MLASIATTIVYSLYPRRAAANGGQQLFGTSEVSPFGGIIPVGAVDLLEPGKKIHNLDARAWLVRFNDEQAGHNPPAKAGQILALYHKCVHLGCTVPYRADFTREDPRNGQTYAGWFLCPCHGSTYSDGGVRVFGPAPRSLDTFDADDHRRQDVRRHVARSRPATPRIRRARSRRSAIVPSALV